MDKIDSIELISAVCLWTGFGYTSFPSRDDRRLREHIGDDAFSNIIAKIKSLETDFYDSDANVVASDLEEMERVSIADFKKLHPGVADAIARALAWCYTYDFR